MADDVQITLEEYRRWVTPRDARQLLSVGRSIHGSIVAVIGRLVSGRIRAAGESYSIAPGRTRPPDLKPWPCLIPPKFWMGFPETLGSNLWDGDARFVIASGRSDVVSATYVFFSVRLEPIDILAPLAPTSVAPPNAAANPPLLEEKGPPVSDAHLEQWARVFRAAYPSGTEDVAARSAAGMFPGKSVPRAKLRAALAKVGTLPRGRRLSE